MTTTTTNSHAMNYSKNLKLLSLEIKHKHIFDLGNICPAVAQSSE